MQAKTNPIHRNSDAHDQRKALRKSKEILEHVSLNHCTYCNLCKTYTSPSFPRIKRTKPAQAHACQYFKGTIQKMIFLEIILGRCMNSTLYISKGSQNLRRPNLRFPRIPRSFGTIRHEKILVLRNLGPAHELNTI